MSLAQKVNIIAARLAALKDLSLHRGGHSGFGHGHCAMELVSWLADEKFSDQPQCVSPVIAQIMRSWNDGIEGPENDTARTSVLRPLLVDVIGTRTTLADEETRAAMAVNWVIDTALPAYCAVSPSPAARRFGECLAVLGGALPLPGKIGAVENLRRLANLSPPYDSMILNERTMSIGGLVPAALFGFNDPITGLRMYQTSRLLLTTINAVSSTFEDDIRSMSDVGIALQPSMQALIRDMCAVGRCAVDCEVDDDAVADSVAAEPVAP